MGRATDRDDAVCEVVLAGLFLREGVDQGLR